MYTISFEDFFVYQFISEHDFGVDFSQFADEVLAELVELFWGHFLQHIVQLRKLFL